jgi:hypothetical protein
MSEAPAPEATLRDVVKDAVLKAAETPQTVSALKKTAKNAATAKKDKAAAEAVVDEMIAAGELYKHGTAAKAPYGRDKPADPNDPDKVHAAIIAAATAPQSKANLVKAAIKETKADKSFVEGQIDILVEAHRLHKHGSGAKALLGSQPPPPPHPLETEAGRKAYAAFVKAAKKVREVAPTVVLDELIQRLRGELAEGHPQPTPVLDAAPQPSAPIIQVAPTPPGRTHDEVTPDGIRTALKTAYDELCLFPEFEDKLVEIRRLYHWTAKLIPGLTVAKFHRELEHLQTQRQVELQPINEVQRALEPELAIRHGDRLLYFAIWR